MLPSLVAFSFISVVSMTLLQLFLLWPVSRPSVPCQWSNPITKDTRAQSRSHPGKRHPRCASTRHGRLVEKQRVIEFVYDRRTLDSKRPRVLKPAHTSRTLVQVRIWQVTTFCCCCRTQFFKRWHPEFTCRPRNNDHTPRSS